MAKNTNNVTFVAQTDDYGDHLDFIELLSTMAAMGLDVAVHGVANQAELRNKRHKVKVSVAFPDAVDASLAHKRFAGRRPKATRHNPEFNFETDREFLAWYDEGRTAEEGAQALGVSRSTFYRRLAEYKQRVEQRDKTNQWRVSKGMEPVPDQSLIVDKKCNLEMIKFQK